MRRNTREVKVGNIKLGNNNKIRIQSMTNTVTKDIIATVDQIRELESLGCEIVRVAVPDMDTAKILGKIIENIDIPLIADIHFDHRLALEAIYQGVHGVRINPGNIGSIEKVKEVVSMAKEGNIKIRIGVNGGSLEKRLLEKYKGPTPEALVESALDQIKILEDLEFYNTVISLKSSDIWTTVKAYEKFSEISDYPLHIGVTEAGTPKKGTIRSSIGIGHLLMQGIGDTLRVSLTGDPKEEIIVAKEILRALDIEKGGIRIISCPTCGRTNIDLVSICNKVEEMIEGIEKDMTIAIMGCAVNGPGEAKEADLGIAGGNGMGLIFKKGEIIKRVPEDELLDNLMDEIEKF